MSDDIILEKLKIVYNAIKKPGSWYTGLAIKSFLQKQYFSQLENFNNKVINAGRWSAYTHFSSELAFNNLLDKNHIETGSTVLIHPLLPSKFVDILIARQLNILSLDINKNTLNWDKQNLLDYIRQLRSLNKEPHLIIQYSFNGIVEGITNSLSEIQQLTIPNLIVLNQPTISVQSLQLWQKIELGSVLWFAGNSFLDDELAADTGQNLTNRDWYISWYLEARTKSILEYHLSKSQEYFSPLLEAYFYILLTKFKNQNWWAFALPWGSQFVNSIQFKSLQEAQQVISDSFENLDYIAIPDVIFELENNVTHKIQNSPNQFINNSHVAASLSKQIYHWLSDLLPTLSQGSLEIPEYYLNQSYFNYFFYTTAPEYFVQLCQAKNYTISQSVSIHQIFTDKLNLPIANFVNNYYFGIQTSL